LPVLVVGIFDKDVSRTILLEAPQLYRFGQENRGLNFTVFFSWVFAAIWHSIVAVVIPFAMFDAFPTSDQDVALRADSNPSPRFSSFWYQVWHTDGTTPGQEEYMYSLGSAVYMIVVFIVTIKISYIEAHSWTILTHACAFASILVWFLFMLFYSWVWPRLGQSLGAEFAGMICLVTPTLLRTLLMWIPCVAASVLCCDFVWIAAEWLYGDWTLLPRVAVVPPQKPHGDGMGEKRRRHRERYGLVVARAAAALAAIVGNDEWVDTTKWWQSWEREYARTRSAEDWDEVRPKGDRRKKWSLRDRKVHVINIFLCTYTPSKMHATDDDAGIGIQKLRRRSRTLREDLNPMILPEASGP
ncbi:hypothetical protein BDK51DRAFT_33253, partial [Blyttiomyces helicus]